MVIRLKSYFLGGEPRKKTLEVVVWEMKGYSLVPFILV